MLQNLDLKKSAQAYDALHRGSALLLKASGKELTPERLPLLVQTIKDLKQRDIRTILNVGGGVQIDALARRHGIERHKVEGEAITSDREMEKAVLPAWHDIRSRLESALADQGVSILDPHRIHGTQKYPGARTGRIEHIDFDADAPLQVVGFVGTEKGMPLNINADDVALQLLKQHGERIREVFFLGDPGGILEKPQKPDEQPKIVSLLGNKGIDQILANAHPRIAVDGGMRKKAEVIRAMLPLVGKVALTRADNVIQELEEWAGAGTLVFHESFLEHGRISPVEGEIFDEVYKEQVRLGKFLQRSREKVQILKESHYMLRVKHSPIGGFSLYPHTDGWTEIAALWSGYVGNGMGLSLLQAAKEQARQHCKVFSLSSASLAGMYRESGFVDAGPVSNLRTRSDVPAYVQNYPEPGRDPHVFLLPNQASGAHERFL